LTTKATRTTMCSTPIQTDPRPAAQYLNNRKNKVDNLQRNRRSRKARVLSDHKILPTSSTASRRCNGSEGHRACPATSQNTLGQLSRVAGRFYDTNIYFELKESTAAKISKAKIELCVRAKTGRRRDHQGRHTRVNELHHEFKHLGPCQGG